MKSSLYLLMALLLLINPAFAQQQYVPATIIFPSGDSLAGEIDYRKWDIEPQSVNFRHNGTVTGYPAEKLSGFRIHGNNDTYTALYTKLDITHETIENMTSDKPRVVAEGHFFYRIMLHGPIQLLLHTDKHMRQHFAIRDQDTVMHLIRESRYIDNPESPIYGKLQVLNHFRHQLTLYMGDCKAKTNYDALDYRTEQLSKAIVRYTACKHPGTAIAAPKKDKHLRTMLGIMAGGSFNSFKLTGEHMVARNSIKASVSPTFGLFMDLPLSRRRQQFALLTELVYDNIKFQSDGKLDKVDVNFNYMSLQLLLRYTYPLGQVRPYINGGMGLLLKVGKGTDVYERQGNYAQMDALGGGRQLTMPIVAGVGVRYQRWNAELRVKPSYAIEDFILLNARTNTMQVLVRYILRQ